MIIMRPKNYRQLLAKFVDLVPLVDFASSRMRHRNTITLTNGEVIYGDNYRDVLTQLNKLEGRPVFCTKFSRLVAGNGYRLAVYEEGDEIQKWDVLEGSDESPKPVEDVTEFSDDSQEDIPVISLEVQEDEDKVRPDWEWIGTLKNTSDDKLALDQYAEEKFDIKLKRNKKLENMIEDFKSALED